MSLFQSFADDVSTLISSYQDIKKQDVIVSIHDGSFKLRIYMALLGVNMITAEISTLKITNDFASINEKRSSIIENWFKKTKNNKTLQFEILPKNHDGLKVTYESNFIKNDEIWVKSEMYLYGLVTDIGGDTKPNIHIKVDDEKIYTISCKKEDIINDKQNRVYQYTGIRVIASQNLISGEVKDANFIEYIEYDPFYDETQILATIQKGTNAWSDVENHVQWVRNLRTND